VNGNRDEVVMDAAAAGRSETALVRPGAGGVRPRKRHAREVLGSASPAEIAPDLTVDQRIGRAAVRGVLIGLVAMSAVGTGMGFAAGFDMMDSLGLGAFAGIWGGPGFGGMLGATLAYVRAQDRQDQRDVIAIEAPVRERTTRVVVSTITERGAA
jgi:hypothetical protein